MIDFHSQAFFYLLLVYFNRYFSYLCKLFLELKTFLYVKSKEKIFVILILWKKLSNTKPKSYLKLLNEINMKSNFNYGNYFMLFLLLKFYWIYNACHYTVSWICFIIMKLFLHCHIKHFTYKINYRQTIWFIPKMHDRGDRYIIRVCYFIAWFLTRRLSMF